MLGLPANVTTPGHFTWILTEHGHSYLQGLPPQSLTKLPLPLVSLQKSFHKQSPRCDLDGSETGQAQRSRNHVSTRLRSSFWGGQVAHWPSTQSELLGSSQRQEAVEAPGSQVLRLSCPREVLQTHFYTGREGSGSIAPSPRPSSLLTNRSISINLQGQTLFLWLRSGDSDSAQPTPPFPTIPGGRCLRAEESKGEEERVWVVTRGSSQKAVLEKKAMRGE